MGNDFATACGGKGANQAVAAALLELAHVSMVCRVGDDLFGQNLLANFRKSSRENTHRQTPISTFAAFSFQCLVPFQLGQETCACFCVFWHILACFPIMLT